MIRPNIIQLMFIAEVWRAAPNMAMMQAISMLRNAKNETSASGISNWRRKDDDSRLDSTDRISQPSTNQSSNQGTSIVDSN